ncbi:MAG TPA: efflux RND transporter periplasmic adaptor subunit [Chryseosolibacter sp.]|nr:efflux RND transporter periplasmic adaptor subunit [Chryseosolibacter sp.]
MKKNLKSKMGVVERHSFIIRHPSFVIFFAVMSLMMACSNRDESHADTYTCPMHPTVVSDRPGSCPVCGMELVRKARPGEEVAITEDLSRLLKSPNETVVASIRTIKGEFKSVPLTVEALGVVTYDTRKIYSIAARIGGRLEQIYLKYPYQPITKGQKIAEIYSPELLTAQRELLFLLSNDPDNDPLILGAKRKLELLGLSDGQIKNLISRGEPENTFTLFSPYSGYLIIDGAPPAVPSNMNSAPRASGSGMSEMGGASSAVSQRDPAATNNTAASSMLREGNYVSAGATLFKVVNTSALRIELDLPGDQAGSVKVGDKVALAFGEGKEAMATVDLVQPFFSEGQNFMKVRAYTQNTDDFQIGQLVRARLNLASKESLWVPRESVLDLGTQTVVFIKDKGVFKPQIITTGIRSGRLVEIKTGLASSDEIAANSHYLVDSESFVKPANKKL